ncbi:Uncharacterised protein [Vibrio cholerae]|nr:Uncharacterised protein [Vibrio cholerae]
MANIASLSQEIFREFWHVVRRNSKHIVHHQNLAVSTITRANTYYGNIQNLSNSVGEFGWNAL